MLTNVNKTAAWTVVFCSNCQPRNSRAMTGLDKLSSPQTVVINYLECRVKFIFSPNKAVTPCLPAQTCRYWRELPVLANLHETIL